MKKTLLFALFLTLNSASQTYGLLRVNKLLKTPVIKSIGIGSLLTGAIDCYYNNHNKISKVSNNSLEKLYKSSEGIPLHIPKERLKNVQSLRAFFKQYDIHPEYFFKSWDDPEAEKYIEGLLILLHERTAEHPCAVEPQCLPSLLSDAKVALKSFLVTDDRELTTIAERSIKYQRNNEYYFSQPEYIEKRGINRLFTCAYIQRVISQEKLLHIHLPRKVLAIRDKTADDGNDRYLLHTKATDFIDSNLKIYLQGISGITIDIRYISNDKKINKDYELVIFAHREKCCDKAMSFDTYNDLKRLCSIAPFDVGYGNIFRDSNGDAIIIDTEYKGSTSDNCIPKLSRYPFYKK